MNTNEALILADNLEHGYPSAERTRAAAMLRAQAAAIDTLRSEIAAAEKRGREQVERVNQGLLEALKTMLLATTDTGDEKFNGHYAAYLENVAKPRTRAAIAVAEAHTGE
jgi:hypothetical protein